MGSRFTILGPTNATSFMIFSFFAAYRGLDAERWVTLVILMAGVALVAGAFLRLADLMQYISRSVVVGYITGAAILIITNQLRHVLGIDFLATGRGADQFSAGFLVHRAASPSGRHRHELSGRWSACLVSFSAQAISEISPFCSAPHYCVGGRGFFSSVRGAISRPTGTRLFPPGRSVGLLPRLLTLDTLGFSIASVSFSVSPWPSHFSLRWSSQ